MKKTMMAALLLVGIAGAGVAIGAPKVNVSAKKHPNIAAAQKLALQAYNKVVAAQKANEYDLDGHAQKAKDLLEQVNSELKLAAEASNANK